MSVLLFVAGAIVTIAGVAMVVFGVPVKEFSFGNTLILAGTTAIVGGLIVVGLGMAVVQLQRIAELLGARPLARSSRPLDQFDQAPAGARLGQGQGRIPFPPKPKPESNRDQPRLDQQITAPSSFDSVHAEQPEQNFAPMLRNPDEPVIADTEEAPLSPRQMPIGAPPRASMEFPEPTRLAPLAPPIGVNGSPAESRQPAFDTAWRPAPISVHPPQTAYFDTMWPVESHGQKSANGEGEEAKPSHAESIPRAGRPSDVRRAAPDAAKQHTANEVRAIAILKSGVVDGMGYTLYVDGSIEAELPQGTLRFASINELRNHLEKNS